MSETTHYESLARMVDWSGVCKRLHRGRSRLTVTALAGLLLAGLSSTAWSDSATTLQRFDFRRIEMGVEFHIRVYGCDSEAANKAVAAAFDRVRELNSVMSDYDAASEIRRLCDAGSTAQPVVVSPDLFRVLQQSVSLSQDTGGAFDVTVGPLTKLWRRARRRGEMPPVDLLAEARSRVGSEAIVLDSCRHSVRLSKSGMRIDLGGIAKGYAADQALDVLKDRGFPRAMVDASGDIVLGDPPPNAPGWRIVIAQLAAKTETGSAAIETSGSGGTSEPNRTVASNRAEVPTAAKPGDEFEAGARTVVLLANQAIATSGSTVQFVEIDGRSYSHIVDPRTGLGLESHSMVTVIAPTGMQADSLASAVSVLGQDAGVRFIEQSRPESVQTRVQTLTAEGRVQRRDSSGFRSFLIEDR
ncbi:FAD:protein FMN transferase [bacterium]|nr:FAD:protein FMN transferase [bacterium]